MPLEWDLDRIVRQSAMGYFHLCSGTCIDTGVPEIPMEVFIGAGDLEEQ